MHVLNGKRVATAGDRYAIAVARFNEAITKLLLEGAIDALVRHGLERSMITVVWVPGAYELPYVAHQLAQSQQFVAVITLGAVIRGATPHFDYVCSTAASGVAQVARETGIPTIFGVITTDTIEQAIERAGTKAGNKGWDAACTAIELVDVRRQIQRVQSDRI